MTSPALRILAGDLFKVRRDLEEAREALVGYAVGDIHTASEALMRAVSTLTLAVERLSEAGRVS